MINFLKDIDPDTWVLSMGTMLGALIGTYLSGRFTLRLYRREQYNRKRETYVACRHLIERFDSKIFEKLYLAEELNLLDRLEVSRAIREIEEENLLEKLKNVLMPPTINSLDIDRLINCVSMISYCLDNGEHHLINGLLQDYRFSIRSLKMRYHGYLSEK